MEKRVQAVEGVCPETGRAEAPAAAGPFGKVRARTKSEKNLI